MELARVRCAPSSSASAGVQFRTMPMTLALTCWCKPETIDDLIGGLIVGVQVKAGESWFSQAERDDCDRTTGWW